jgi:hypothetical protein
MIAFGRVMRMAVRGMGCNQARKPGHGGVGARNAHRA